MATQRGLGRGLGALINDGIKMDVVEGGHIGVKRVPITDIRRNSLQPRQTFDEETLRELTASIIERGILQPLLVRKAEGDQFELIAGERRLRAATQAGLADVPVIVIEAADHDSLELALIENLQRENLNMIEEAEGYQVLSEKYDLTQEQIAAKVGKSRPSVANALRLLDLPAEVRTLVAEQQLSPGHAKVLSGLEMASEQILFAKRAVLENLSVRNLEKLIEREDRPARRPRSSHNDIPSSHLSYLYDKLHGHFGTSVRLSSCRTYANGKKGKGIITIDFYSNEDLTRLLDLLGIETE